MGTKVLGSDISRMYPLPLSGKRREQGLTQIQPDTPIQIIEGRFKHPGKTTPYSGGIQGEGNAHERHSLDEYRIWTPNKYPTNRGKSMDISGGTLKAVNTFYKVMTICPQC